MRKITVMTASAVAATAIAVPAMANAQTDTTSGSSTGNSTSLDQGYRRGGGAGFETIAETIGITFDELRSQMADGQTISEIAQANGVSADTVAGALVAQMQLHLADHVAEGDLTQTQADDRLASVDEHIDDLLNGVLPSGGSRGEFGVRSGMGGFNGGPGMGIGSDMRSTLPDLLGIDVAELRAQLHDGATIAELATSNGVAVDDVITALVTEATVRLDGAVTDGKITQERADEVLTELTDRITAMVNGEAPVGRGGFEGRHEGPRGGFAPDADA